ncbi:MAG: hypothetical protein HRF49_01050 [bacterium]
MKLWLFALAVFTLAALPEIAKAGDSDSVEVTVTIEPVMEVEWEGGSLEIKFNLNWLNVLKGYKKHSEYGDLYWWSNVDDWVITTTRTEWSPAPDEDAELALWVRWGFPPENDDEAEPPNPDPELYPDLGLYEWDPVPAPSEDWGGDIIWIDGSNYGAGSGVFADVDWLATWYPCYLNKGKYTSVVTISISAG